MNNTNITENFFKAYVDDLINFLVNKNIQVIMYK